MSAEVLVEPGWLPRIGFRVGEDLLWALEQARPRRRRPMGQFAEEEIVIPDGPYRGERYRLDRQPYARLWFEAIDRSEGRIEQDEWGLGDGGKGPKGPKGPKGQKGRKGRKGLGAGMPRLPVMYQNFIAVGPTQSGKTLTCLIIPVMYHLFEMEETVICVVPDENMVADKWRLDFLPAIRASRYRDLLPVRGEGARGGTVSNAVTFGNGVTLKFMTAGGGDTNRAAFTSRIVAITELNKFGVRKASSTEADMYRQVRGRMRAYGDRARLYGECTVTTEKGLVWREYSGGTASRIAYPCCACGDYVTLGREHLVGWEAAQSAVEAERLARWVCPSCGVLFGERERRRMVRRGLVLHRNQQVTGTKGRKGPKGRKGRKGPGAGMGAGMPPLLVVYGEDGAAPLETYTLGFRWSAFDNLFLSTGYIGSGEWSAKHLADDGESAEREQMQFVWAVPIPDSSERSVTLRSDELCHRQGRFTRGVIPPGCALVAFLDLGKYRCHWVVLAGGKDAASGSMRYWLVDCGIINTEVGHLSERDGLTSAMREFHDICEAGWVEAPSEARPDPGERWSPALRLIDSGKWAPEVYAFMMAMSLEGHEGYFPSKGHGVSQDQGRVYREQRAVTERVILIGDRYHLARQELTLEDGTPLELALVHIDVDAWKSRVHTALTVAPGEPGSLVLWRGDWREHMPVARSLLAEVAVEEFVADKGMVVRWEKKHRDNHFLDGFVGCAAGLDYLGYLAQGEEGVGKGEGGIEKSEGGKGPAGRLVGRVEWGGALKRE